MKIFSEREPDLLNYMARHRQKMEQQIEGEDQNYLLNVNETQYVNFLCETYAVKDIEINFDGVTIMSSEQMIGAEYHSRDFYVEPGRKYKRQVITYHLPYSGNADLLKHQPGSYFQSMPDVKVDRASFSFDVVNYYDDPERVKRSAAERMHEIKTTYDNVKSDVTRFNSGLSAQAQAAFHKRKEILLGQNNFLAALGVPVKKSQSVPETFAVPIV